MILFKFVGVYPDLFATQHERFPFMHVISLVQKSTMDNASYFELTKFFPLDKCVHSDESLRK